MRDYLHPKEIDRLLAAARASPRCGKRSYLLALLAVRHALRISEAVDLRLGDIARRPAQAGGRVGELKLFINGAEVPALPRNMAVALSIKEPETAAPVVRRIPIA